MGDYAGKSGDDFKAIYERADKAMTEMEATVKDDMGATLSNMQMNIEFMDGKDGMGEMEYNIFLDRIKIYAPRYKAPTWKIISKGKETIDFEDVQPVIDEAKAEAKLIS